MRFKVIQHEHCLFAYLVLLWLSDPEPFIWFEIWGSWFSRAGFCGGI